MANNIFIDFLPPWIETGVQPAFYDKESGTVLQQTARMYAKVNELVESVNHQNETIDDYIEQFNELHDYVHDYFDNLDVQEEINHKLEDMASDGSLSNLIEPYIDDKFDAYTYTINTKLGQQDAKINNIDLLVSSAVSGAPTVVTTSDDMTDTSKIYVLTTDGHWYYYANNQWNDGGTYQSTGIGEGTINYIDFDAITSELYEIEEVTYTSTTGSYVNQNGTIASSSNFEYTSPIELKTGDTIILKTNVPSGTVAVIAKYDDGTYTPLVVSDTANEKFYYYTTSVDMEVVLSARTSNFTNLRIIKLPNHEASDQLTTIENSINVEFTEDNKYVYYVNGTYGTLNSYEATDYVPVMPGSKLSLTASQNLVPSASGAGLAFYDSEKRFISGVQYLAQTSMTINVPNNAYYIRFSHRKATANQSLKYVDLLISIYNKVINPTLTPNNVQFYDFSLFTKVGVVGDSYASGCFGEDSSYTTAPEHYSMSWPSMLQRTYGFTLHNFSYGGISTRTFISSGRLNTLMNTEKCDVYLLVLERNDVNIVNGGENDYLGSISDIDGVTLPDYPDTFYGNYGRIIENIMTYSPDSKIIMIAGDYLVDNVVGTQFNDAMEEIADYYHIPIIKQLDDAYFQTTLYRDNRPNGAHPGAVQYNGMSLALDRLLNNCLQDNISYFKYTNPQ